MQLSRVLLAQVPRTPKAPFSKAGKTSKNFDALFVQPQRPKKAWDGQDKDAFFRDKYAHVHAKQRKQRELEQAEAARRRSASAVSGSRAGAASDKPARAPAPDFAARHRARLDKDHTLEFVHGTNAVRAVLARRPVTKVLSGHRTLDEVDAAIVRLCTERGVPIETGVPQQHLNIVSDQGVHNKVVAQTRKRELPRVTSLAADGADLVLNGERRLHARPGRKLSQPFGVYIDQVTDTHNMGALLRSACWFGADFVAYSARNSAPLSPAVVRASSGAAEFTEILEVAHPLRLFDTLKAAGWSIVASAPSSKAAAEHGLAALEPETMRAELAARAQPVLLVVGSEGEGVRTSLLQRSTHAASLRSAQHDIDSLNVSVATALLLSAIA